MNKLFRIHCAMKFAVHKGKSIVLSLAIICLYLSACQSDSDKNTQQTTTKPPVTFKNEVSSNETNTQSNDNKAFIDEKLSEVVPEEAPKEEVETNKVEKKVGTPVKEKVAKAPKKPSPKKSTSKKPKEEKLSTSLVGNSKTASSKKKKEKKEPLPKLVFDYTTYDFGVADHGDTVVHKFYFVNEGDAPAIISDASSSCGCTVPEYPKKPIKAGERAFVKAVFATKGRLNTQKKSITIKANTEPNYTTLYLTGEVYNKPKKKEPIDSTKIDSIKKAKVKAKRDSLKLKKKSPKKSNSKKDEKQQKTTNATEKKTKEQDETKDKEEIDYFLPTPKPKKDIDYKKKEKP